MILDITKWPIFSLLEPDFLEKVTKACVYGSSGNEALMVTIDDEVFAVGSNCSTCLGLGDCQSTLQPRKVEHLCGKKVSFSEVIELPLWSCSPREDTGHSIPIFLLLRWRTLPMEVVHTYSLSR